MRQFYDISILKFHKKVMLKKLLFYFFILNLLSFMMFGFIKYNYIKSERTIIEENEANLINLQAELLGENFDSIIADLEYLTYEYSIEKKYLGDNENEYLSYEWLKFIEMKGIYDQIRFIDYNGNEKIRVDFNEGDVSIIPEVYLQNKSSRYYFKEAIELEEGEVFISKLDLNIENGKVEKPIKPMIRFAMPVFNEYGNKEGIVIINYLASHMIDRFEILSSNSKGQMELLNNESYWLSAPNSNDEWTFMFDDKKEINYKSKLSDEWELINENIRGNFYNEKGLYTFNIFSPLDKCNDANLSSNNQCDNEEQWIIVSYVEAKGKNIFMNNKNIWIIIGKDYLKNYYFFIVTLVIAAFISYLRLLNIISKEKIKMYATYDMMTGVYNRRAGIEVLERIYQSAKKEENNFTLCYIDVNGLKLVNDNLGHEKGDELIKTVVEVIKGSIRENDLIIRVGGDEFLLAFPKATYIGVEDVWGRIRKRIDEINKEENRTYLLSVSHGLAEYKKGIHDSLDGLINEADKKMYLEKIEVKKNLKILKSRRE